MSNPTDKRIQLMIEGANLLQNWLIDLIYQGIQSLNASNSEYWENLAALLVDHKLGGLARRIRRFDSIIQEQDDWFELILSEIGQLYLIAQGLTKLDQFAKPIQAELLAQAGKSITKKEILLNKPIHQHLLPLGQSFGREEQLSFRKTWYWAKKAEHFVMELEFIVGRQSQFTKSTPTGLVSAADIYYYPSTLPFRVIVQNSTPSEISIIPKLTKDFTQMHRLFAQALGKNPWLIDFPCLIQDITIQIKRNEINIIDDQNQALEIKYQPTTAELLSLYASKSTVSIFGLWNGQQFQAISLVLDDGFVVEISNEYRTPHQPKYWA